MTRQLETQALSLFYLGSPDGGPTGNLVMPFRFNNVGPRVMATIKLTVVQRFVAPPFDWTQGGLVSWFLWLCRVIVTDDGQRVPVQNLVGTRANPMRLDNGTTTDSVNGASFDNTIGGDGIDGELTVNIASVFGMPSPILASLRARYNAVAPLCDDEWAALVARIGQPYGNLLKVATSLG